MSTDTGRVQPVDAIAELLFMVPSPDAFAQSVQGLGIGSDTDVIICDTIGSACAARVWWLFRLTSPLNRVASIGGHSVVFDVLATGKSILACLLIVGMLGPAVAGP